MREERHITHKHIYPWIDKYILCGYICVKNVCTVYTNVTQREISQARPRDIDVDK